MYQLRSSGTEIAVCPQASQIGVDVIVWAIVSESLVDGKEFFLKCVWFCICNFLSDINAVE